MFKRQQIHIGTAWRKNKLKLPICLAIILLALTFVSVSQTTTVAQGGLSSQEQVAAPPTVRTWQNLPTAAIMGAQEEIERPVGLEAPEILQALKSQPFVPPVDPIYSVEEDTAVGNSPSVSSSGPQPLAPTLVSNFEAVDNSDQLDGYLHRPPDPVLAAGPNHVGVVVNSLVTFYTKNGIQVGQASLATWFSDVYTGGNPFDPRIAYDHHEGHWLMMALIMDAGSTESWYLLSVSQTDDPTGDWWNYKLNGKVNYDGDGDSWADYPDLGFDGISSGDGGAVYITSNQFTFAGSIFSTSMLLILPKSALYSGSAPTYYIIFGFQNDDASLAFTLRTAHTFGNPGGEFLINTKSGGWNKVTLWRVNPTYPPDAFDITRQATITIGSYSPPPDAEQMGGSATLDTIDNRMYNAVYRNGHLYAAFTQAYDWGSGTVAALHYLKIDTSTNTADINSLYGADGKDCWFPAIYTDSSDNIVIVFARSSPSEYAGIRYTGRLTTDSSTQPSAQLKAGETYYTGGRWGDYFGIANDPADTSRVWIYGEWAKDVSGIDSDWEWGTWIGQVTFEVPTVGSVDPGSGYRGQTLDVTITGTNFTGTTVSFGAGVTTNNFTVDSVTQITANITIAGDTTTGMRDVSVTTAAGTGTLTDGFEVTAPLGMLRVFTSPAVPTTISIDGIPRSSWGLNWLQMTSGTYTLSFTDVVGFATPVEVTVTYPGDSPAVQLLSLPIAVQPGATTRVEVNFIRLGTLRVVTSPALPATIFVDGNPMNEWGLWVNLEAGDYLVSFEDIPGYTTPSPVVVAVIAGATTNVTGVYVPS